VTVSMCDHVTVSMCNHKTVSIRVWSCDCLYECVVMWLFVWELGHSQGVQKWKLPILFVDNEWIISMVKIVNNEYPMLCR